MPTGALRGNRKTGKTLILNTEIHQPNKRQNFEILILEIKKTNSLFKKYTLDTERALNFMIRISELYSKTWIFDVFLHKRNGKKSCLIYLKYD